MSASQKSVEDVHLDGDEESATVLKGITPQEIEGIDGDIHLGDVTIVSNQYAHGVEDVDAKSAGSILVPTKAYERSIAIDNSSIETVNGDLAGRTVVDNSEIGVIEGNSKAGDVFARNSHNLTVHGDIEVVGTGNRRNQEFFDISHLPTVIGEKVEGDAALDSNSLGGLIVADKIDTGETNGNFFTISAENPGWRTSQADEKFPARKDDGYERNWEEWQEFKQTLKQKEDEIYGIPILNPDGLIPKDDSERERFRELTGTDVSDDDAERFVDRFFTREQMMQEILDENLDVDPQNSLDTIAERIGNLEAFTDFENERYASLLNLTLHAQESEAEKLGEFGEILDGGYSDGINSNAKKELFERLQNNDIFDVANQIRYDLDYILRDELDELMTSQAGLPDVSELKEDWEEWDAWNNGYISLGGMLERAYEENEEDVANLVYLAEFLGEELELDTEEWVSEQKKRKLEDEEYEIDGVEDIEQALEEELEDEKRRLTLQALEKLGEYEAIPAIDHEYKFSPFVSETKEKHGFTEFTGDEEDWREFAEKLNDIETKRRENSGGTAVYDKLYAGDLNPEYFGIPLLKPEIDEISSFDDFWQKEKEMRNILDEKLDSNPAEVLDEIGDSLNNVRNLYEELDKEDFAELLNPMVEAGEDKQDEFSTIDYTFSSFDLMGQERFVKAVETGNTGENVGRLASTVEGELTNLISEELKNLVETKTDERYHDHLSTLTGVETVSDQEENELLIEAVDTIEDEIWTGIGDAEPEKVDENTEYVTNYDTLHPRFKGQILGKLTNDIADEADSKREDVEDFGDVISSIDPELQDELYEVLKTDTDEAIEEHRVNEHGQEVEYSDGDDKFGSTLFDIAVNRKYDFFVDDEADRIEELLETEGSLPDVGDSFFESDSPYKQIIEELTEEEELENGEDTEYGEMSDQELAEKLRMVDGLAERLGIEYDASSVFGMLKGKEGQRQNTDFEPEAEEIDSLLEDRRRELEKDVQNKLREYTKQNIKELGFEAALDEYEEATGERPEDIDEIDRNELAALKVRNRDRWKRDANKQELVDTLLEHQNDVYELETNQKWLEQHDFSEEELIDPDLSNQVEGGYRRPEDPEYNSELQVEVDPSDVQMDTEREKQQYWDEVTELLDRVGVEDEVEDIEEAEQAIEELEEPEDEQDYQELKDAINNYHSVENRAGGIPDELTLRVADPMDTTRMGQGFGSCHDIDGGSYAWASISNAVDANKMIFYAEDEQGRERARVKAFITEDEELIYHNTSRYKDIDIDTSDYFEGYMERVSDELGLELKHSTEADGWKQRTELLEAHDWYSGS